ncbi:hypothetical protein ZTR_03961 [Talaromyces verruculosus]|nr:hypothetical protein ZTR_03961 [Talaromyces verruculosus]
MAQLKPRGPLLSGPSVAGVSDDCKNDNTKHPKSKRIITPARKEQNRVAQRLYRQRHKQHKAREDQTKTVDAGSKPRPIQPRSTKEAEASSVSNTSEIAQSASISDTPHLKVQHDCFKTALSAFDAGSIVTNPNYQPACTLERFIVDDVSPIQADGHLDDLDQNNILLDVGEIFDSSLAPSLYDMAHQDMIGISAPHLTTTDYSGMDLAHLSLSTNGLKPDLASTFTAKYGANQTTTGNTEWLDAPLSSRSVSEAQDTFVQIGNKAQDNSHRHQIDAYLADPYQNAISFSQVTILNICALNAKCLGMAPEDFISDNCLSLCSPFYRPATASDDPTALLATVSKPYTPKFLQPTLSQILFPHHPIFDLIPIPAFRERAIMLATTSPALLNSLELKQDIMCGGLVCWGTRYGSSHGGNGQPWDVRSWEAAPWFLKKWRLLVGGKDGDLWKQSVWWRNLRGEPMASD